MITIGSADGWAQKGKKELEVTAQKLASLTDKKTKEAEKETDVATKWKHYWES